MKMNTPQTLPDQAITLDMIRRQKAEKLAEIRASKQRIMDTTQRLFHPDEPSNVPSNALMSHFSSGIALFNGVMTGFKIIKRIRSFFRHR